MLVDQLLTNPGTGVMAAELVPVATALKSMKRSNSGVTWIRQRNVTDFLTRKSGDVRACVITASTVWCGSGRALGDGLVRLRADRAVAAR